MINVHALPRVNRGQTPIQKTDEKKPDTHHPLPVTANTPAPVKHPSAALSKVYFGGVNLSEAIQQSDEVAKSHSLKSVMSMQDYVDSVADHPLLLRNTNQYALDMINKEGVRKKNIFGRNMFEYDFFSRPQNPEIRGMKGNQGSINNVITHIRAAAKRQDLGKKPIVLMGGPGSGKTTIGDILVDGYMRYSKTDEGARYATKLVNLPDDLRMGDEYVEETLADPLLYLPLDIRKKVLASAQPNFDKLRSQTAAEEVPTGYARPELFDYKLGIEGDLTPKTKFILRHLQEKYLNEAIIANHIFC